MRIRWKLTQVEQREYLQLGEKLNAGGAMLDLSGFHTKGLEKFRVGQSGEAYALTCRGGSVFVVQVTVLCLAPAILQDIRLWSPGWNLNAFLAGDPLEHSHRDRVYRLLDGSLWDRDTVLNHRLGPQCKLRRGQQMEGLLLAQAFEPIPAQYKLGGRLPIVLGLEDQFGDVREFTVQLMVQPPLNRAAFRRVHSTLFEESEPIIRSDPESPVPLGILGQPLDEGRLSPLFSDDGLDS